jgi:biotin transport system substrate-specific component
MACFTGLAAQARIYLPNNPFVPVTGQVFAVLLCGALFGGGWGGLSQLLYVGVGALGAPWFQGMAGGVGVVTGVTGGYLLGFIPAAMLVGFVTRRFALVRRPVPMCLLMVGAVGLIYAGGALQFSMVMHTGLKATFDMAVAPFIALDIAKAMLAANLAAALLPKASDGLS